MVVSNLFVGVAGWSHPDWPELLAAPATPAEISVLSGMFDLLEITSSYYHPPDAKTTQQWLALAQSNTRVRFTVRVWQKLVRERSLSWKTDVETVKRGLLPLQHAQRLGALILPFPSSFENNGNNEEWLWRLLDAFAGMPLVVEAPHSSWQHSMLLPRLAALGVAVAGTDSALSTAAPDAPAPDFKRFAYLRLNGRGQNHDDAYGAEELAPLAAAIRSLSNTAGACYVVFHNHRKGQALANALQLQTALAGKRPGIPENLRRRFPQLETLSPGASPLQLEMFQERN